MARDLFVWPFDTQSPWNMPIGSGAIYELVSPPPLGYETTWFVPSVGGYANIEWYSIPIYVAALSDPVEDIYQNYVLRNSLHVPAAAQPALGIDGQMTILNGEDTAPGYYLMMSNASRRANGDIDCQGYVSHPTLTDFRITGSDK